MFLWPWEQSYEEKSMFDVKRKNKLCLQIEIKKWAFCECQEAFCEYFAWI